eukprot:903277-Prymnesium_polylepis.1
MCTDQSWMCMTAVTHPCNHETSLLMPAGVADGYPRPFRSGQVHPARPPHPTVQAGGCADGCERQARHCAGACARDPSRGGGSAGIHHNDGAGALCAGHHGAREPYHRYGREIVQRAAAARMRPRRCATLDPPCAAPQATRHSVA